jgi:hypothetical protein
MIVEKQMECRLAGEIEVLGENLPQGHKEFLIFQSFPRSSSIFSPQRFILKG